MFLERGKGIVRGWNVGDESTVVVDVSLDWKEGSRRNSHNNEVGPDSSL